MSYAPSIAHARHAHDEVQVSILVRGGMREEANGVGNRGTAGDVCLKPAGFRHEDVFENTRIVCIDGHPSAFPFVPQRYAWHRLDGVVAAGVRVAERFLAGEEVEDDLTELLAALAHRPYRDRVVAKRAADLLEASWRRPVRLTEVGAELNLHPVYVARVFREQWGVAPREYVLRLRARAAADRIASTSRPLVDIALETGFSDQSHMTRAVSRFLGVTPASLRRLACA
jgi:AraC family transcriptional regulator